MPTVSAGKGILESLDPQTEEAFAHFFQHLVPVFFSFRKGDKVQPTVYTAFVLSVDDTWLLVTAGHCISEVREMTHDGYVVEKCLLLDSLLPGAKHPDPIPFDYEEALVWWRDDDDGSDYAVMRLHSLQRLALEANNVRALNEQVWERPPSAVDFYWLIGLPAKLMTFGEDTVELAPAVYRLESLPNTPAGFKDVGVPQFYGRILDMSIGPASIKGMSGGPILAFKKTEDGRLRYWLIAVQSSWLASTREIRGCPTNVLGRFIREVVLPSVNADASTS